MSYKNVKNLVFGGKILRSKLKSLLVASKRKGGPLQFFSEGPLRGPLKVPPPCRGVRGVLSPALEASEFPHGGCERTFGFAYV